MGQIKNRQCPSCGGSMIGDSEKQIYRCISCGSSYDYDYFREERLHEMGDTYLSRGEVNAAVDAYRLILKKSPHDFRALRGLMLAAAYLKDIDGLAHIGEAKHFPYDSKLAGEVFDAASEEDKDYFSGFRTIYSYKKQWIDCNREIELLRRERKRTEGDIGVAKDACFEYYFHGKHGSELHPNIIFIMVWCLIAFFCMPCLGGIFDNIEDEEAAIFFAVAGGLALLIGLAVNFLIVYPKMKTIKKIAAYIKELEAESEATARKIKALEAEAEQLSDDIGKAVQDLIRKDRLIVTDSVKEQVPETGKIKKHQCPSCGGSLRIDRDKQMYHCTFCGSAYDYEYFREDRIHEAGETYLSRGEFMATTEAYEFMLKKDPHDFLALRGLMLAAAHLTDMSELEQVDKDFSYDSRMVSRVIESASEEDKQYFTEFAKAYAEKKRLADCSKEIEALREEKNKINSIITQNNIKYEGNNGKGGFTTKADEIGLLVAFLALSAFFMLMAIVFAKDLTKLYATNSEYISTNLGIIRFCGGISLVLAVVGILGFCLGMRRMKKFEKTNAKLYDEARKLDDKIRELENESAKLTGKIRRFIHDFVRKDKLIMKDNE